MSKRFRIKVFVAQKGKNHQEAWELLDDKKRDEIEQVIHLLRLLLQNAICEYHPVAPANISIFYEKETDIITSDVLVCCFVFTERLKEYLNDNCPVPVNVTFLKPFDQRTQN